MYLFGLHIYQFITIPDLDNYTLDVANFIL
jgi:hypothetical protein